MLLSELFENTPDIEIKQLSIDSRVPMKDCIFFCLSGIRDDGHDFINEAIKNGASVVVYQEDDVDTSQNATFIKVNDVADCLNYVGSKFYDFPANKLETFIIAGCNGNTSINYILTKLISNFKKVGSIGVNGIFYDDHHLLNKVPTLTILDNQKYLNEFVKKKIKACILEANAMSLSYKKLDSIKPNIFIYTNTNEYSTDFEEIGVNYYDSIRRYLYTLEDDSYVLLNSDDVSFKEFSQAAGKNTFSYGFKSNSDYLICDVKLSMNGSTFSIRHKNVINKYKTKLLGLNNIYNLAASIAALDILNYSSEEIGLLIPFIEPLKGILEPIYEGQDFNVIVDCAQDVVNIDSLLEFANNVTSKNKKVYLVWGLDSSDDEQSVKELLDTIKNRISNLIITERNTYRGNVFSQVKNILKKYTEVQTTIIEDRRVAIESSIELLNSGDTLLVLGKGNDKYIITNMGRQEYEGDYEIAKKAILKRLKEEKEVF